MEFYEDVNEYLLLVFVLKNDKSEECLYLLFLLCDLDFLNELYFEKLYFEKLYFEKKRSFSEGYIGFMLTPIKERLLVTGVKTRTQREEGWES